MGFLVGVPGLFYCLVEDCLELVFFVLLRFQPSYPKAIIVITVASSSCQVACIFRPLNSLLPVSVMMFCVAAWILVSLAYMWASMLFFLQISSPRYLYVSTSSRVWPLSFIYDFHISLFLLLCILLRRIQCGILVLRGLWCQAFLVPFWGHGVWGRHRPSIGECLPFLLIPFLFLGHVRLVPLVFRLSVLHILWRTVHLLDDTGVN